MANPTKARLFNKFPDDANIGAAARECLDSILVNLNNLLSQGPTVPGSGIGAFGANIINPASSQIVSIGSRTSSITTGITTIAGTTGVTFYWDGTNGSIPFQVYRDDSSIFGPFIAGSPFSVSGLSPSTKYYFYGYFDDVNKVIGFANVPGVSVGSPAIAFTAQNILANQQQILRGRIPIGIVATTDGVTTPAAGTTTVKIGGGGGGAGGGFGGKNNIL